MGEIDSETKKAIMTEFEMDKLRITNNLNAEKERQNRKLEERLEQRRQAKRTQKESEFLALLRKKQEEMHKEASLITQKAEEVIKDVDLEQHMSDVSTAVSAAIKFKKSGRKSSSAVKATDVHLSEASIKSPKSPKSRRAERMKKRITPTESVDNNQSAALGPPDISASNASPSLLHVNLNEITTKLAAIEGMIDQLQKIGNTLPLKPVQVAATSIISDPTDAIFTSEGLLNVMDESMLTQRELLRFKHAKKLVALCGMQDKVILKVASTLPDNENINNAFRNSFCWDAVHRTLFIRRQRFETVGGNNFISGYRQ